MSKKERSMRREGLICWLEEVTRQLKTGKLMIDGEKVAVPEEMAAQIKKKAKKGRNSLKLKLEWEAESLKETREKEKEAVLEKDRRTEQYETPADSIAMVRDYDSHVLVCTGGDCKKRGSKGIRKALKGEIRAQGMLGDVRVDAVDCLGLCKHGPNVVVYDQAEPKGSWYLGLQDKDVPEVVGEHLKGGMPVERLAADRRPRKAKR